jgi:phage baseplate assembly protein W
MSFNFYGVGFAFPPSVEPTTGRMNTVGDTAVVEQALRMLLSTTPGERLMRPTWGCDLRRFLFAPNTVATRRLITEEVMRAITLYEDRIDIDGVDVTPDDVEPAQVNILVRYRLRRTGAAGALLQPFSLDGNGG